MKTIQNKKKRVAIISPTGLLGSGVYSILKDRYSLVLIYRDKDKMKLLNKRYGGVNSHELVHFNLSKTSNTNNFKELVEKIGDVDTVINCAGIINKYTDNDLSETFFINSVFPHLLSTVYKEKLIQITTDCVFDGKKTTSYNEDSTMTAKDIYGLSKWLGEPKKSLVLRTSIIGSEISGFVSLLEWTKKQKKQTIKGFVNHYWNGVTTRQFGKICDKIIGNRKNFPRNGVYHVFGNTLSKYDMLRKFNEKYKLKCTIIKDSTTKCNRVLSTKYELNKKLKIPSFDDMLKELE